MADQRGHEDWWADRNLRMIGRRLPLPADPTARQRACWKRTERVVRRAGTGEPLSFPERGVRFVRRHRLLTVMTTAAAAVIVLAVLLVTPRSAVVEASTIFGSLRQTLLDGFELTFEDIGQDGVHADGRLVVVFRSPAAEQASAAAHFDRSGPIAESLYLELHAWAVKSDSSFDRLDVRLAAALSDARQWVYVRTAALPERLLKERPLAWLLMGLTGGGAVLELDGLWGDWNRPVTQGGALCEPGEAEIPGDDATSAVGGSPGVGEFPGWRLTENGDMERMFLDILTGRASGEQMKQVATLLAESAGDVGIAREEPGLWVLTAREFDMGSAGGGDLAMLAGMVLVVKYRDGRGIVAAALENLGEYGGTLRLAPLCGGADERLFDTARVVEPGVTRIWDLSGLKSVFDWFSRKG